MSVELAVIIAVIAVALVFDYTNGFHDAANAIATTISTRAMSPRAALIMAAVLNLVGAFLGTNVATTVGSGIIDAPQGLPGLAVVFAALIGAIAWNLITWYFGLPSSSSHALIGGLVGAAIAAAATVQWNGVFSKVIVPMVISPLIGFALAGLIMIAIMWAFRRTNVARTARGFRRAQIASAAAMSLGHGLQDAQKTMGVIVLALVVGGYHQGFGVPPWVVVAAAGAISAGTYAGGWRIIRTLGRRIIDLDPPRGFAAEVTASGVLYTDPDHHQQCPGRRRHTPALRRPVGRGRPHPRRVGLDDSDRRSRRRAHLHGDLLDLLTTPPAPAHRRPSAARSPGQPERVLRPPLPRRWLPRPAAPSDSPTRLIHR